MARLPLGGDISTVNLTAGAGISLGSAGGGTVTNGNGGGGSVVITGSTGVSSGTLLNGAVIHGLQLHNIGTGHNVRVDGVPGAGLSGATTLLATGNVAVGNNVIGAQANVPRSTVNVGRLLQGENRHHHDLAPPNVNTLAPSFSPSVSDVAPIHVAFELGD